MRAALGMLTAASLLILNTVALADTLKIINWNVKAGSVEGILKRQASIAAVPEGETPDILILQEINSYAAANLIADYMGMHNYHSAISDFGDDAEVIFFGLETAVISNIPIRSVTEYQPRWQGKLDPNGPILTAPDGTVTINTNQNIVALDVPIDIITNSDDAEQRIARGLLRVELENGLVIYPVHFKSNRTSLCGDINDVSRVFSDLRRIGKTIPEATARVELADTALQRLLRSKVNGENNDAGSLNAKAVQQGLSAIAKSHQKTAASRENTAAALMKLVAADLRNDAIEAVIVAGDFNTPLNEPSKTGRDLGDDACLPEKLSCTLAVVTDTCQGQDGFDDTHHILQSGIVDGARMTPQLDDKEATHTGSDFAPSPIDTIYTAGELDVIRPAKRIKGSGEIAFGSDHYPIQIHVRIGAE